jgi:hypothetical protein
MHHTSDGRAPAAEFPRPPTPAGGKTRPAGPAHSARPGRWRRRIGLPGAALLVAGAALIAGWLTGPAASAASTDLACGRPASASSNTGTAGNAVDCVAGTVWQSATTKPQQLQVDLGATLVVDHVTVVWGAGYGTSYKIRTSPDGASWHTVVRNTSGLGGTETLALPAGTGTRWIQLYLSQYAGSAGFTVDELSVYGSGGPSPSPSATRSPSASPSTSPTPSSSPTRSSSPPSGGHTWNVTDATGLKAALAAVAPGDTIHLADGSYADQFVATRAGSAAKPISLTGGPRAVLSDPLFNPGGTSCPSGQVGYGLWLQGAAYWNLTGFTVVNSKKGIVMDGSPHVTIDGVTVRRRVRGGALPGRQRPRRHPQLDHLQHGPGAAGLRRGRVPRLRQQQLDLLRRERRTGRRGPHPGAEQPPRAEHRGRSGGHQGGHARRGGVGQLPRRYRRVQPDLGRLDRPDHLTTQPRLRGALLDPRLPVLDPLLRGVQIPAKVVTHHARLPRTTHAEY